MKITLPLTLSIALLATMIAASLAAWFSVPPDAELAVHFGLDGTPNRYAPAPYALSIIPLAALASTLIFVLSRRRVHMSPVRHAVLWLFVIAALAAGHFLVIGHALSAG